VPIRYALLAYRVATGTRWDMRRRSTFWSAARNQSLCHAAGAWPMPADLRRLQRRNAGKRTKSLQT
jgi:hypothetical protein